MTKWTSRVAIIITLLAPGAIASASQSTEVRHLLPIDGQWQCRLDPEKRGRKEQWFASDLPQTIKLPGTVTAAGLGNPVSTASFDGPTPVATYQGPAWYRREVVIPESWRGKHITLLLERTNWVTGVWANNRFAGMRNSLAAPHVYDLTGLLTIGSNHLSVMVDNSSTVADYIERPGDPSIASLGPAAKRHCEDGYNGVLGRIELQATDPIWIESVDAYPDVARKTVRARIRVGNITGQSAQAQLAMSITAIGSNAAAVNEAREVPLSGATTQSVELEAGLGDSMQVWSEFSPRLYAMTASISVPRPDATMTDTLRVTFGTRKLERNGSRLLLNGIPLFLRGRADSAVFPLTGYAPMDVEGWRTILRHARDYGLNHLRFHSWCPPEAAFQAADEMGFLFHIEPTTFDTGWVGEDSPQAVEYGLAECLRIVETYGNHPSFGFLSVGGNERLAIGGPYEALRLRRQAVLIDRLTRVRDKDPRHLYTCATHPWTAGRHDDYYVTGWGKATYPDGRPVRLYGCNWGGPDMLRGSRFIEDPPETAIDYRKELEGIDAPVIVHEVGQWAVFPNIAEAAKYTGAWRAGNLDLIRRLLEKNGLIDQASDFVRASGQLSLRLYKEEIESALRTPGLAGFDLLDLIDYPWQKTATIGMLDAFWDSKGLISPEAFREFCGPTVPLARLPRLVWTTSDTLIASVEVAHYAPTDLPDAHMTWTLSAQDGRVLGSGRLPARTIKSGGLTPLGTIRAPVNTIQAPAKLILRASLDIGSITNSWELWVYPDEPSPGIPAGVQVMTQWNEATKAALGRGERILLLPSSGQLTHSLPGIFTPVYWSWLFFRNRQVGTMGLLCNPEHPALADFPTEFHSNWQWWEPITHSHTMVLDDMPRSLRPIVQVIDRFDTCRRLGVIFEGRVGPGSMLVCSIDLSGDLAQRPASRQLKRSIMTYMAGPRFRPTQELLPRHLDALFAAPTSSRSAD